MDWTNNIPNDSSDLWEEPAGLGERSAPWSVGRGPRDGEQGEGCSTLLLLPNDDITF